MLLAMLTSLGVSAQTVILQQSASVQGLSYSVIDLAPGDGKAAGVTFGTATPSTGRMLVEERENFVTVSDASGTMSRTPFASQDKTVELPSGASQVSTNSQGDASTSSRLTLDVLATYADKAWLSDSKTAFYQAWALSTNDPDVYDVNLSTDYNFVLAPQTQLVLTGHMILNSQPRPAVGDVQSLIDLAGQKDASFYVASSEVINVRLTLAQDPLMPWLNPVPLTELAGAALQSSYWFDGAGITYFDDPLSPAIDQTFSISISNTTKQAKIGLLSYSLGGALTLEAHALPEPGTWASFSLGLVFLAMAVARQRRCNVGLLTCSTLKPGA